MAQGAAVDASPAGASTEPRELTDKEAYEIQQYDKIVRFTDAVLHGSHPTIKAPDAARPPPQRPLGPAGTTVQTPQAQDARQGGLRSPRATDAKNRKHRVANPPAAGAATPLAAAKPAGRAEINPVLLEKSGELVRAEITLQRQRLERALRDEVDQRRLAKNAQSELHSDLDLSDVLAKALLLVPASAAPPPAGEEPATNDDAASDSFDDNTFYSSQHETPQSQMTSRVRNGSDEPQVSNPVPRPPEFALRTAADGPREQGAPTAPAADAARPSLPSSAAAPVVPRANVVPGLNNYVEGNTSTQPSQNTASGEQSLSDDLAVIQLEPAGAEAVRAHRQQQQQQQQRRRRQGNSYMDNHPPSPLIRGHALQPVAPQAAQISPLAAPGQGQGQGREAAQPAVPRTRGTPAQVAALRHGPSAATSPESSSQGGRGSDKKRNKKKKRKADRQAPEVEAYPCIKVEPRSPSPLNAPSYLRANKRQRQSQGQVIELEYEPSYERPLVQGPPGPYLAPQYRDEHVAAGYQGARAYPQRAVSTAVMGGDQGYGREYVDERRLPAEGHARGYGLAAPPFPYSSPRVSYHPRSVSQTFAAADGYREPASSFRDYGEGGPRLSVRPEAEAYPGPAKAGPSRLVVDAFGREYFDAAHPAVHRPSAPPGGAGEGGHVVYERLPPRAVSRHPGPEAYGEGGMVYGGGPGPAYAMPRRVVTQPAEYGPYEYRNSQQREYPAARPMGPPGELMQVGAPLQQRRPVHEGPRGYATRAASMMPVEAAGGRYEVPAGYGRMQSVRPDMGGREYAAGMHGDGPREAMPPYLGDYAPPSYQRPQAARAADEIAFIERPRGATQEIVYADDARREVYR